MQYCYSYLVDLLGILMAFTSVPPLLTVAKSQFLRA